MLKTIRTRIVWQILVVPNCLRSASSSATKYTLNRENTGGVLSWFPVVEHGPSVWSTNGTKWNFYDFCLENGPMQLKRVAVYSSKTSVKKNVEGDTVVQWDRIALYLTPRKHLVVNKFNAGTFYLKINGKSIYKILPDESQFFSNKDKVRLSFVLKLFIHASSRQRH